MKVKEERVEVLTVGSAGDRLDVYVAGHSDLSRARVQALVAEGRVRVDGQLARKSDRLEAGQEIEVRVPPPEALDAQPENIPLDVLFEDSALLVVNKPAGMVTHPAPGHPTGTLVNALLAHTHDLSGIGSRDLSGQTVHAGDADAQIRQVWANLEAAVKAAGGSLTDIVKTTTYVVGAENLAKIRPARLELLPTEGRPTSTTIVVAGLADPGLLVEVEAIAVIEDC